MNIENLLYEEIQAEFEGLRGMEVGTDKHRATVDAVVKLCDRAIEVRKFDIDTRAKEKERETELKMKLEQIKEDRKDRFWKNGIAIAGIGLPVVSMYLVFLKTLEFEKEGTITVSMGRSIIQKFVPNLFKK